MYYGKDTSDHFCLSKIKVVNVIKRTEGNCLGRKIHFTPCQTSLKLKKYPTLQITRLQKAVNGIRLKLSLTPW